VKGSFPSALSLVHVLQALVARELVGTYGVPENQAAEILGVAPSTVSQYISGRRLSPALIPYLSDEDVRNIARRCAGELVQGPSSGPRPILEAANLLAERGALSGSGTGRAPSLPPEVHRALPTALRGRIRGEQEAVAECMRLAQRSRDELTRAVFRQIASDSLRHAEIVAALAAHLDRGLVSSPLTGVSREDLEKLIRREREAEATNPFDLGRFLGGIMKVLWDSMEADERKHEALLEELRRVGTSAEPNGPEGEGRPIGKKGHR